MSKPAWQFLLGSLAVLAAALLIGLIAGKPLASVAIALALLLLRHCVNLLRFDRWLRSRATHAAPDLQGLWGEVIAIVDRLYRRKVYHKRRTLGLLREFRRMTAAMPDGAILLGPGREILWFNRAASRWLDLKRKVDYGLRIDNLVRVPDFVEYLERDGEGPPPRVRFARNGDLYLSFRLVTTSATGPKLLLVRDVTAEARLDSMRKDFVANASHELRSPLTVVSGYLDALAEDPVLDPAWRGPVQEMRRQSERMGRIVHDLLELSRLEASGSEADRVPVDVGGMLALLCKEIRARPEPTAEVTLQLDTDAMLLGSEAELHSIISNLLSNAAKYTPPDGRIDIRWWSDERGANVEFRDTGIGIAAEHLPRLTERFYRVDAGRSRKLGGSGLGLAIVKHALQRHAGRLEVASVEGKGSSFTCRFPASRVSRREELARA
jgi:two-component system phosphate regulon sensor histidine kinase PhoR